MIRHRCVACGTVSALRLCDRCVPAHYHRLAAPPSPAFLGDYDGPVGLAVRRVKVRRDTHLATHLCLQAARRVDHLLTGDWTAVVPAPSLWHTRLLRGFSLASILAAHVSRHTGLPAREILSRSGWRKQSSMARGERFHNALQTIRCTRPISGRILLVDDVWTTGATARACAYQLMSAGAENVAIMALCAVPKNRSRSR